MVKFSVAHQGDDEGENTEIVGSKDLRESFKSEERVRGSFSINGYEFRNFESNSPANLVAQINSAEASTGVHASVDDGGKLVLQNNSTMPIRIGQGAPFEAPAPMSTGNVADDVVTKLKAQDSKGEKPKNTILELMGLEATDEGEDAPARPGFETGMSADERKEAKEKADEAATAAPTQGLHSGQTAAPLDNPTVPTGDIKDGSRTPSGAGRIGQGDGFSAHPDGTPAVPGTPANPGGGGGNPQANVSHENQPS